MRILHQDRFKGEIKLMVEVSDDLWHLYNIVRPGDLVYAATYRRDEAKTDKIRAERTEKKRMTLGIRVEKMEFHEYDNRLRILGVIEDGPQEIGSYHTLSMEEGEWITVVKDHWTDADLDRVKRSVDDAKKPNIVFVSLENDEATIAVLRQYGLKNLATITGPSGGKMYEQKDSGENYYDEIITKVKQLLSPGIPLVVLGPGFAKETLLAVGKQKEPELFRQVFVYHTGQAGMQGIHELMKRGIGGEVLKDGLATYGPQHVRQAADAGAVELLLVLDTKVREANMEPVMHAVEQGRGRIVVVSEHHEGGRKLDSLGGMAALLRYRLGV
jgi:protein pelota